MAKTIVSEIKSDSTKNWKYVGTILGDCGDSNLSKNKVIEILKALGMDSDTMLDRHPAYGTTESGWYWQGNNLGWHSDNVDEIVFEAA